MSILVIAAGIIPMLIYPLFLYWMDRYEKEPLGLLAAAFLWGFVPAAILSLVTQIIFGIPFLFIDETGQLSDLVMTVVFAPISEEFFKGFAVLIVYLILHNEFDGIFDGIIYGGLVGFGFAAVENILYFSEYGLDLFFTRAVLFGLNHAFFTSLTGIGFGIARHAHSLLWRWIAPLLGLLLAIFAHALHNISIILTEQSAVFLCLGILADWGGVMIIFVIMVAAIRQERQWIIEQLQEEIGLGTLSQLQYAVTCSPARRFGMRLGTLMTGRLSLWWQTGLYFNKLTELAYKKHAHSRRDEAGARQTHIDALRSQAGDLSTQLAELFNA
ncbi:MAG: PrsW family intramembrane metalloprotease [Anaerolineae bacterium]|nr:PrsW family intramembrane metalloprotease [Anaerolineae bacterium]